MDHSTIDGMVDIEVRTAHLQATFPRPGDLAARIASWPVVAQVVVLYAMSRVVSTALFLVTGTAATSSSVLGSDQGLLAQLTAWDGGWYQRIAAQGYPAVLPEVNGAVQPNTWAFMPLHPWLANALALGSSAAWPIAAVLLSTACGLVASLLLAVLVKRHGTRLQAITAVTVFSFGPTAYVLQTAYAESMGLMLLFLFLLLVDARRYRWAMAVAAPLAFARPGLQAVALLVALHLVARIVASRRGKDALTRNAIAHILGLGLLTFLLGLLWPIIAGFVTGRADAYLATELAWRAGYIGSSDLGPFTPWVAAFTLWFGRSGLLLLVVVVVLTGAFLMSRPVRSLGSTIALFAASWFVYLLAVFFPQSSAFRLLMPAAPLAGALPVRSMRGLVLVTAVCVLLQAFWLYHGYGAPVTEWTAP